MKEVLHSLLGRPGIWLGSGLGAAPSREPLPTGFAPLDAFLPGGGWPADAVTELLLPREGIGELRLLLPALAQVGRRGRWVAFVDPPHLPYAPALAAAGLFLSRLLVVRAGTDRDRLWAAEQCLRSGACGGVLAWPRECDDRELRRLQLAAGTGGAAGLLFRPERAASCPSPAPLRLRLARSARGVAVEVLKGRGGAGRRVDVPLSS